MEEKINRMEKTLAELDRAIRGDGNGEPGLSTKVHLHTNMLNDIKKSIDNVMTRVIQTKEKVREDGNDLWMRIGILSALIIGIVGIFV